MTDYGALLREIAVPRLVGTPNHARVRATLRRELTARGFAVEEHAFSARPSRLLLGAPALVHGVNLIAYRPRPSGSPLGSDRSTVRPSVWLTAHYDSKGQPISMAVRLLGAMAVGVGAVGLPVAFVPALVLLVAGALVLSRNRVTDDSPGAVDNACGVLAVLATVDRLPRDAPVGVILPDAEELGLVGARALVRERPDLVREAVVVNFDGIDDAGRPVALLHRGGPVGGAVAAALGARRAMWLPVVVDGIAFAAGGGGRGGARECVTIVKGGWGTMRRVHTPADTAARLTLAGVRQVAEGVARALATP